MARERNHIPLTEHELQMKYKDLIPPECAVHLEDKLRQPAGGWTFETMMKEIEEYFEVRVAYSERDGGMTRNRNRATWANDTKMMRAPLSIKAPPQSSTRGPTVSF